MFPFFFTQTSQKGSGVSAAERREEGATAIEQELSSPGNAIETGMEPRKHPRRLPELFHALQGIFQREAVVVEGAGGRFEEERDAGVAQADAPLDVFPSV